MKKEQFFRDKVKKYYKLHGRQFFWRHKKLTPFQVMVTEIFLKKTRAETVDKYVPGFLRDFPSNFEIIRCNTNVLFKRVKPLGLARQRIVALKKASLYLRDHMNNILSPDVNEISKMPYIGLYTANATACFAFNKNFPILDVNTSRIISRFFSMQNDCDIRDNDELHQKAKELLPRKGLKEYNWGLLDFGAAICKPKPLCSECMLSEMCKYYKKIKQPKNKKMAKRG